MNTASWCAAARIIDSSRLVRQTRGSTDKQAPHPPADDPCSPLRQRSRRRVLRSDQPASACEDVQTVRAILRRKFTSRVSSRSRARVARPTTSRTTHDRAETSRSRRRSRPEKQSSPTSRQGPPKAAHRVVVGAREHASPQRPPGVSEGSRRWRGRNEVSRGARAWGKTGRPSIVMVPGPPNACPARLDGAALTRAGRQLFFMVNPSRTKG